MRGITITGSLLWASACIVLLACGTGADDRGDMEDLAPSSATGGAEPTLAQTGGNSPDGSVDGEIMLDTTGGSDGSGGTEPVLPEVTIVEALPDGFSPADPESPETSRGGYQVLGPLAEVAIPEGECGNILRIIARDFQGTHDDFENADDWDRYEVLTPIGESRKPEKVSDSGPAHFEEWYQNIEGINLPFAVDLWLEPVGDTFVFDSTAFFPLEDVGFDDEYTDSFLFTTELHTNFEYQGGEVFTFRGDDDVFVFINGHLAVNLSGVHEVQEGSVDLDEQADVFGLVVGSSYTFDLFQAERQPSESNFRVETTLDFTGCGEILPGDIVVR